MSAIDFFNKTLSGFGIQIERKPSPSEVINESRVVRDSQSSNYTNGRPGSTRRRTFNSRPKDVTKDLRPQVRSNLVENSRGLERNSGLVAGISRDFSLYSVGDNGFRPTIETDDEDFNKAAVAYFEDWALRCSACGRFNLTELCFQIAGILPIDGEVFALKTRVYGRPAVQLIETHNISTETDEEQNIIDGIKRGRFNRPVAYGVKTKDGSTQWVKAGAMSHIFQVYRPSSVRYAPLIQHSINNVIDEQEIISAENNVVKDNQRVSRVLKSKVPGKVNDTEFNFGNQKAADPTDPNTISKALNCDTVQIGENEELKEFESNRPSSTFVGLLEFLQRDSSLGVLPYEWVANPKGVAGAAMRLIVGKANRIFRNCSRTIINRFLIPLWFYVIGDAIDQGLLPPVKGWHRVKWSLPKQLTVDFGRDEAQNRLNIEGGYKTIDEDCEERGLNADEQQKIKVKRARKLLTDAGYPESTKIPLWMLYKPTGTSLSTELEAMMNKEIEE